MKSLLTLAGLLLCVTASATSQCPPDADPECGEQIPALIAASFVGFKNVCSRIDPEREKQYSRAFEEFLNTQLKSEERDVIYKSMKSQFFQHSLKEVEWRLEQMKDLERLNECASILSPGFPFR
jgi:hypothetical protein